MNNEKLYKIIDTINTAGIKELIINKEDDKVMIYGADDTDSSSNPSIIIVSEVDNDVVDTAMGINRVSILHKRMNLFDMEKLKMTCTLDTSEEFAKVITIKEGRRRISYTFANPTTINVPINTIEDSIDNTITLTKEYVDHLAKVNQSLSSELIILTGINNTIRIELNEDGDSFTDLVSETCVGEFDLCWNTRNVIKMLKYATKQEDSVELGIGVKGFLYITINEITFILLPQTR